MARKVHGGRSLLNLPGHHSTAAIVAEVKDTGDLEWKADDDGYKIVPTITCAITDCDNKVNIEFDVQTANQLENSLYKVDVMLDALTKLREGMIVEHHRLHDRLDEHPNPRSMYGIRDAVGKRSKDIK